MGVGDGPRGGNWRGAGGRNMTSVPLALASSRWHELTQAYGAADDIPRLLEALATVAGDTERMELWFGVWATLCPDSRVYTAAYAAVPHLLTVTQGQGTAERVAAMHVVAQVEASRHLDGAPEIPADLVLAYATAIESLPQSVAALAPIPWDAASAQVLAAALLVGKHQPALARAVLSLAEGTS